MRDHLRAVVQQHIDEAQKRTASDTVTEGVRVRVKRYLLPEVEHAFRKGSPHCQCHLQTAAIQKLIHTTASRLSMIQLVVCFRSYFVPNQSYPYQKQYFFAYSVTISNEGEETVQLLNRHWIIYNADGHKQEVRQAV